MNIKKYLAETRIELTKVTWSTKNKVLMLVVIVFVIVLISLAYVSLVDMILSYLIKIITKIF